MKREVKSQRGASMVEFALVLPLLILLVFGIIEFGLALYDKAVLTNASREGARKGIVAQVPRVQNTEIKTVVKNYCQNYLITFGTDTIKDSNIAISPDEPRNVPFGTDLTVTVYYSYDFLVLKIFGPINFTAVTLMKME